MGRCNNERRIPKKIHPSVQSAKRNIMQFSIIKGGQSKSENKGYFEMRVRSASSEYEAFSCMIAAMIKEDIPCESIGLFDLIQYSCSFFEISFQI